MIKKSHKVVWDEAGKKGGPIVGSIDIEEPENWDEVFASVEGTKEELLKAMVTQYCTGKKNWHRENVLKLPDRDSKQAVEDWFYHRCTQQEFQLHRETVLKLRKGTMTDQKKKAIKKFLDKVDPQES